jgi:hypothetical protein
MLLDALIARDNQGYDCLELNFNKNFAFASRRLHAI